MTDMLDSLNDRQRQAVLHSGGPLLVVAGPGSGKTRVIACRIAYLVQERRVSSRRILGVTFTARAADEMRNRVRSMLLEESDLRLGTFHWFCQALLRRYSARIGLPSGFRLLSPGDGRRLLRAAVQDTLLKAVPLSQLWPLLSAAKCGADLAHHATAAGIDVQALTTAFEHYDALARRRHAVDLDDLLILSARLLEEHEDVRARCCQMYDELLVDEYQDVSPVQQRIVRLLTPRTRSVCVVGDDDQAIYGWRFASAANLRRFLEDFEDATVVTLEVTYRSTKCILRAARSLARYNTGAIEKRLETVRPAGMRPVCYAAQDEIDEANWVARSIAGMLARGEFEAGEVAVLFRVHTQSRVLEDAFLQQSVPYTMHSGERFYARSEVRAAAAFLRLALDERDDSAACTLLLLAPGIGHRRLQSLANQFNGAASLLTGDEEPIANLTTTASNGMQVLRQLVRRVAEEKATSLPRIVDTAIAAVLELAAGWTSLDYEVAEDSLNELRNVALESHIARGTLRGLLERLDAVSSLNDTGQKVQLMTLHTAKGSEFAVVFMVGMEEGLLPHRRSLSADDSIEEERRLCYVGVTRASDRLYLSYARSRDFSSRAAVVTPSRFIGEMGNMNVSYQAGSRRDQPMPRLLRVSSGERVVHPRWGRGVVTTIHGSGQRTLITVEFAAGASRTMQLWYAPLRKDAEMDRVVL